MTRKDFRVLIILLIAIFTISGCADLKDKFIRKPKEEKEKAKRYYAVREYDVRPSLELYTKRYVYWKHWHKELLAVLDHDNHKKTVVAIEQEASNLMAMQSMLVDEKAEQLEVSIAELTEIEKTIKKERLTGGNKVRIRKKLESLGRRVKREFSYNKMRGFIRDEFRTK